MKKLTRLIIIIAAWALVASSFTLLAPKQASALSGSDWQSTRIIDDGIFFNSNTMNTGDIQNFFNAKVPTCDTNGTQPSGHAGYATRADWGRANGAPPPYICLKNYSQSFDSVGADAYCGAIAGGNKSAADIVFNVSRACGLNPQSLIVLLQKEQSLVTDDWPWPIQYRSATGYGCPDTAACDSQYYGFFNQVYNAAHQFKRYIGQPQLFNYAIGRNSFVAYNPNGACGGTNLTPQTQATAALYNYTPYQPNAAALANLYGSGDSCSAYGNRNFWRMFNDWFGTTRIDSFTIAITEDGSQNQFLLFGGLKQAIPDPETKIAWGIQNYPLVSMPADYLATIPSGPHLDRLTRLNTSDQTVFFMDSGKRYRVMSQAMFDAWNFGSRPITNVPPALFYIPSDGGQLTYTVKNQAAATKYLVDGANGSNQTILRPFQSDSVQQAWEGDGAGYTEVSSDFFSAIDNAVGATLSITKIAYGGNEYQVIAGQRMAQPANIAPLYPGVAQSVSAATFNRLVSTSPATHLIRSAGSPEVYLVDNGTKHHVLSANLLAAWSAGSNINLVNSSYVSLIPDGSSVSSYIADSGGQLYIANGSKITVPSSLATAYGSIGSEFSASSTLMNLFPTASAQATGFIKGANSPQVYLLDNSGRLRYIDSPDKLSLWAGSTAVTVLSDSAVNSFPTSTTAGIFVSDGSSEYVMEAGQKLTVASNIKSNWGLSSAQTYSDGTLSRFSSGGSLDNKLRDGALYYLIRGSRAYVTIDQNIANAWAIDTASQRSNKLVNALLPLNTLTRFVGSSISGDNRAFVIDGGNWYNLSAAQRSNLGRSNEPTMTLDPSNAPNAITDWTSIVVKDSSGKHYVIDGATKRSFANLVIQNHWTGSGSLSVPTTTNGFLNLLPNNGPIERAIKGSAPAVYSAEAATKRWIQSGNTYQTSYAPFAQISDELINVLPAGADIP